MAIHPSTGTSVSGKSYPVSIQYEPPALVGGLVQHALVTATTQVQILSIVEATGSASVADIVAELAGHPDPVGALKVMIDLKILIAEIVGVLDGNTIVRRADPQPDPHNDGVAPTSPLEGASTAAVTHTASGPTVIPAATDCAVPLGLERLETSPFTANVVIGPGAARRAFARMADLRRPGIYALLSATTVYVGTGSDVAQRVALGQQPIGEIDTIVVITDRNGNLTDADALAAERMLWTRVAASRERLPVNRLPDGASIDAQRYSELDLFLGEACLALRHSGVMFAAGAARNVLAGPRQELGRVGPLRPFNTPPAGDILELTFGAGMVALAARQSDTRWILLQGADVRIDTVASANCSTRFLRAAWLHAGLLELSADGRSYVTTRDLVFQSGSGAAQFCVGSKGRSRDSWVPIDPDGGLDPATPALIAA
jgi:hypothetical protein